MMNSKLAAFPCRADKKPLTAHGFKDARRGLDWGGWPLVGFATGIANGVDVLDIDGAEGRDWYDANFDAIPLTRAHSTRRGLHLLFRHADGLRNSESRIAPGVDVRAEGGYAIWWPREGLAVEDAPICEWPEWLLKEARGGTRQKRYPRTFSPPPLGGVAEGVSAALMQLNPHEFTEGDGHRGRWLALMNGAKAAGVPLEVFCDWTSRQGKYARDDDQVAKNWQSLRAEHAGAFYAELKAAGIRITRAHQGQGPDRPWVPFRQAQGLRQAGVDWRLRFNGIVRWLERNTSEDDLFSAACLVAEIMVQHRRPEPSILFISPELQPTAEDKAVAQPETGAAGKPERVTNSHELFLKLPAHRREEVFKQLQAEVNGGPLVPRAKGPLSFQHAKNPAGIPPSLENALVAIDALNIDCRYDEFHDRIIVKGHESGMRGDALENLENVTLKVRQAVLSRFGFDPSPNFTFDALKLRCLDHVFDPVRDYLDGLRWDGRPRLDKWLVRYCKADDTELNRAIGRKTLVAAVRRVRTPGCKFDYVAVLEGKQGVGKSTLLKILAGEENFSDNEIVGLEKREQQEAVQGIWIYEMAELEGLSKSDVTKVKLFVSKTVDSARPAYGRSRVDRPRRVIFVATTNEDDYLRDRTGNRRWWPVRVGKIDLGGSRGRPRSALGQASAVEAQGEPLVIPEALLADAAVQQQARMEVDPWEDEVAARLARLQKNEAKLDGKFILAADAKGDPEWRVSSDYLLTDVLELPKDRQTNNHTKRLAGIMRSLGWTRPETTIRIGKLICLRIYPSWEGGWGALRASNV